jgi:hypothetical protein
MHPIFCALESTNVSDFPGLPAKALRFQFTKLVRIHDYSLFDSSIKSKQITKQPAQDVTTMTTVMVMIIFVVTKSF